MQGILY